ncbi:hypothetical protein ACFWBN_24350 [Streptomyces sp. NPDC059989]|uniref:hypothetical protein n=1 Tax=Streptomyces sp. NPDC059989 TaxID=3347026 RepID=UPI003674C266
MKTVDDICDDGDMEQALVTAVNNIGVPVDSAHPTSFGETGQQDNPRESPAEAEKVTARMGP